MKNVKAYFTAVLAGLIFAVGVTYAAGETRFRDLIIRTAASIGTSSAANSKAVLDLVSTTKGFLPPRMTEAQRDAISSPPQGLVVFNTTTQTLNQYNGTTWEEIGGGGSGVGGINFIENTDLETNITGYNTYADAAAATPVDGTGGTSSLTLSQTTTAGEVQRGAASLEIAKGASNEQGEGVSYDFTVDGIDNAASKKIIVTFDYETSANYASDQIRIFVYDRDGAALQNVLNSDSGNLKACTTGCKFVGEFYTTSGSNDYRLIWHVAGTSATAYDVYIDNIRAGPDSPTPTAIVQDLGTEAWADNQSNATTSVRLSRLGNRVKAKGVTTFTGAMSGAMTITIPTAYAPDTTEYDLTTRRYNFGLAVLRDTGTGWFESHVQYVSSNTLTIAVLNAAGTNLSVSDTSSTNPFTWASTDTITWEAEWIVSGWNSGAAMSSTEALFTTAKARYSRSSAQTVTTATILDASTKTFDTLSSVTTGASWKFTAPRSGYYRASATVQYVDRAYAVGNLALLQIFKNGGFYSQGAVTELETTNPTIVATNHTDTIYLAKGDYIDFRASNTGSSGTNTDGFHIEIEELPDFSVFGVYGSFELLTTTSSVKTPSNTAHFHQLTNNALTLTPGTWALQASADFGDSGSSPTYSAGQIAWYAANGADSGSVPALLSTASGLTILSAVNSAAGSDLGSIPSIGARMNTARVIVRVSQSVTVYAVTYATMTTAANARITVYANAERLQ